MTGPATGPAMRDAWCLAVGTLTRIPVPAPRTVGRAVAGRAMLIAPLIGAVVAVVIGLLAQLAAARAASPMSELLVAALAVAALAYVTRAIHLDGVADTADALGSARPREQALDIARRSDIGPFGVVSIVLVLIVEIVAYAGSVGVGHAAFALTVAVGTARLSLVIACMRGVPAARPNGLGATVAGSVSVPSGIVAIVLWITGCVAFAALVVPAAALATAVAVCGSLLAGALLLRTCVRRLGGITGDVLGAIVELTCATALVILVAVPS